MGVVFDDQSTIEDMVAHACSICNIVHVVGGAADENVLDLCWPGILSRSRAWIPSARPLTSASRPPPNIRPKRGDPFSSDPPHAPNSSHLSALPFPRPAPVHPLLRLIAPVPPPTVPLSPHVVPSRRFGSCFLTRIPRLSSPSFPPLPAFAAAVRGPDQFSRQGRAPCHSS